ncbi:MAG: glycosyltransferase family 39 protein [Candidatus Shapirobacteria bacterium]|nr:glycosyltransferase family 39 protein [Candidatus Shapirobacteria bacterium]MDD3002449.1 glycosyltransferase family 39 protein [Candidatus Shapirobacteria bacterium]MDD4383362.1 glycosyltransferase family 39 protein [Candidatus Shapirobacteria bacterium]
MTKNKFFCFFLLILISGFYFFSRLQNLTSIPVFGDEAIYIRWAQIIQSEETLRFIPQTDGKQPLFMWINAVTLKLISDPLISGRIVSVFAGFGLILLLFFTTAIFLNYEDKEKNIFKFIKNSIDKKFYSSIFSSLIYCLIPFTFFFDRMALADTLLSFFGLAALLFSFLLSKYPKLDLSLILGAILGFSWLTKSPAIYFIVLSFVTFLLFNYRNFKLIILPIISSIIAFLIYNILRLGPQFSQIAVRNKDYVWSISEILKHPFDPLNPHLLDTLSLYNQYISWPLLIFSLVGLILLLIKTKKSKNLNFKYLVLIFWWILPLIANAAMAKVFTARYILFTLPPLIILISIGFLNFLTKIKSNILKFIFIITVFTLNINFIYKISVDPFHQKIYSTETGYLSDWTSGWGIKESADFLKQRSQVANVIIGTEGAFGTLPNGLQIYCNKVPQLTIIGQGLGFTETPSDLIDAKNHGDEVYLLMNKSRVKIDSNQLNQFKIIKSFDKPDGDKLLLYEI